MWLYSGTSNKLSNLENRNFRIQNSLFNLKNRQSQLNLTKAQKVK